MKERDYFKFVQEEMQEDEKKLRLQIQKEKDAILAQKQYVYQSRESDMDEPEVISAMEDIDEMVALTNMQMERADLLQQQIKSPYFGKVTYRFDEDGEEMPLYMGIHGYYSREKQDQVVFDWRAPVGSLFYEGEVGKASYKAPMGEVTGEILEKKQFQIEDGKMTSSLDTNQMIHDEMLLRSLSGNSSKKMHGVVATIQKQQNRIIRNESAKTLVVDGRAGSGKTVIAMHRVAWLLYQYRKKLNAEQVMILSPNGVFSDYISGILPELGEHMAPEKEWDSLVEELSFLQELCETRLDQTHHILEEKRVEQIKRKSSLWFFRAFCAYLKDYEANGFAFKDFHFEKQTFPKERLELLFYQTFKDKPLYERFYHMASFILGDVEDATNKEVVGRRREQTLRRIQQELIAQFGEQNIVTLYVRFLQGLEQEHPGISEYRNEEGAICYEDVQVCFYLQLRLYGCRVYESMMHLVVDEMQDYNVFQYGAMDLIFPCKKTILGDRFQVLFYDEKETVLDALQEVYPEAETYVLQESYRSTKQITEFCNRILGIQESIPFLREGKEPEVISVEQDEEIPRKIREILERVSVSGYENIAILTPDEESAGILYRDLVEDFDISFTGENSAVYFGGITILPKYFAKGMEFDVGIVLHHKKRKNAAIDRNEYYISCTRALHELYVIE